MGGGKLEYGCDTTGVDESFSYYYRESGKDSYAAYVKSSDHNSETGPWKTDGALSKIQTNFKAGTQYFDIEE